MPKREVHPRSRTEMIGRYPIEGKLPDWYFRIREISNAAWRVEGCDIWGREVSRTGGDPERLLAACVSDAAEILRQT